MYFNLGHAIEVGIVVGAYFTTGTNLGKRTIDAGSVFANTIVLDKHGGRSALEHRLREPGHTLKKQELDEVDLSL